MGNEQGRGKPRIAPSLEKKLDPSVSRLDLKSKNIWSFHFQLVDCAQYTNLVWLNLPNNFLDSFPPSLYDVTSLKTLRLNGNRIAEISPNISQLSGLTSLDLSKNDFQILTEAFGSIPSLIDLNCHWNNISEVSPALSKLVNLKALNLSLNRLSDLPPLPHCLKLENIDLSHNRMKDLPESFGCLTALHTLNLAGNQISLLKNLSVFAGLTNLVTLDLQNNELKTLPQECGALERLKYLRLRGNLIQTLPDCINFLTNLEELEVSQNRLEKVSPGIGNLTKLQNLFLYQNCFEEIPDVVGRLRQVKEFGVAFNSLKSLPPTLCGLTETMVFLASNNQLTDLHKDIFIGMSNVQELFLNHNLIREIPTTITCLQNLQKIEFTQNKLTSFPDCPTLTNLQTLELGANAFTTFPHGILALTNLQQLNLFGNELTEIPSEIGKLVGLKKLYLSYNRIQCLPPTFTSLTGLRELLLAGNMMTRFPPVTFSLINLVSLSLNNNQITEIPPEIHFLTALEGINLNNNKISRVGPDMAKCTKLKEIDLSHNELGEFPENFHKLQDLIDLDLSGNAISHIPELFEEGCSEIHQLKISFNQLTRVPNFKSYQRYGFEESTAQQHVPWISCTGNAAIQSWYEAKADPKKLRPKFDAESKKQAKRGRSDTDYEIHFTRDEDDDERSGGAEHPNSPKYRSNNSPLPIVTLSPSDKDKEKDPVKTPNRLLGVMKRPKPQRRNSAQDPFSYRFKVGWSEIRGRRQDQQDTICVEINFRNQSSRSVLCCFDGHSGEKSSEMSSRKILPILSRQLDEAENVDDSILSSFSKNELLFPAHVPTTTNDNQKRAHMADLDSPWDQTPKKKPKGKGKTPKKKIVNKDKLTEEEYCWVMNSTFENLHKKITKNQFVDGTAALVVIIEHNNNRIIVANSGDQRAVLARGTSAVPITTDHKPDEPVEKLRIYHVGGFVNEQKRVDGILTLSRSLGDNYLQPHVTFRPDVDFVDLTPEDRFLIIACDGLWDVLSNEEAVALVSQVSDPCKAAALLVDYAHCLGSGDNISAIVYFFGDHRPPKKPGSASSPEEVDHSARPSVSASGSNSVSLVTSGVSTSPLPTISENTK